MDSSLALESRTVAGLPLVNAILDRLGFDRLLAKALPAGGRLDASQALGVLVRTIALNDRQPVYTHVEWARQVEPSLVRLTPAQADLLNDDRVGRALDRLFDADRAALMTELVLRTLRDFTVDVDQLHTDSTTLTLTGDYTGADGKALRGKPTLHVTYEHHTDHRPDLKPRLFVLTVSADGAVPIHDRGMDGNTNDSMTHIDTWETLRTVVRRWEEAVRRPNPRRRSGPEDVWKVVEAQIPSKEGYRIVWVWHSLMALEDDEGRQARIEKAWLGIERLETKLRGTRCRLRLREQVEDAAAKILKEAGADRWVRIEITERKEPVFRQEQRGHPGPNTTYLRKERLRVSVAARVKDGVIEADARTDGMFPLISNCRDLSLTQILEAYTCQPKIEKRHEPLTSVQDMAPVWLKHVARIEALLFLYVVALLIHALLERELRQGMAREKVESLPLYPEERECRAPSTERILDLFAPLQRHCLRKRGNLVQVFEPELSTLHKKVLALMRLPVSAFRLRP